MGAIVPSRILAYREAEEHHLFKLFLGGSASLLGKMHSLTAICCKLMKGAVLSFSTSRFKCIQNYWLEKWGHNMFIGGIQAQERGKVHSMLARSTTQKYQSHNLSSLIWGKGDRQGRQMFDNRFYLKGWGDANQGVLFKKKAPNIFFCSEQAISLCQGMQMLLREMSDSGKNHHLFSCLNKDAFS